MPKAHQVNQWCMIVNLSSLHGQSVNDGISTELSSIQYSSIDEAIGQATQLVKIDLKDAYCISDDPGTSQGLGILGWCSLC